MLFIISYTIFRVGVRELKMLYNISMSPLISHVAGSIHGLHSIRAYNKQNDFTDKYVVTQLTQVRSNSVNTKHLYNFCTMLDQRRWRWADVVKII